VGWDGLVRLDGLGHVGDVGYRAATWESSAVGNKRLVRLNRT
jgi:hypothetical protein